MSEISRRDINPIQPRHGHRRRAILHTAKMRRVEVAKMMARGSDAVHIAFTLDMPLSSAYEAMRAIRDEATRTIQQSAFAAVATLDSLRRLKEISDTATSRLDTEQGHQWADRVIAAERTILDKLVPKESARGPSITVSFAGDIPGQGDVRIGEVIEGQVKVISDGGGDGDGSDGDGGSG